MKTRHILCPTDLSEPSLAAIRFALALAEQQSAELHVVVVYEPSFAYTDPSDGCIPPADLQPTKEALERISFPPHTVPIHRVLQIGYPIEVLLDYVDGHAIDLIVMGTHGRTGLSRFLMGSVAEAILRRARCPVLTVRHPELITDSAGESQASEGDDS